MQDLRNLVSEPLTVVMSSHVTSIFLFYLTAANPPLSEHVTHNMSLLCLAGVNFSS